MSLLKTSDFKRPAPGKPEAGLFDLSQDLNFVMGRKVDVLAALPTLKPQAQLHFCTEGKWSTHELLTNLIRHIGPSQLWMSSWGLTEDPVRQLIQLRDTGYLSNVSILLDHRIKVNSPAAYHLAKAQFQVELTNIHAKVIVLINEHWNVTVLSSANMTRNKRIEAEAIFESQQIAHFHKSWIAKHFN